MSTSCIVLVVSFIVLTVAQVCTAEEHDSLNHKDAATVAAIKEVGKTMACFGTTLKRGLRYQQDNDDVIRELHTLPDMVDALINEFKEVKSHIMNKDKVDELTEEIEDLKKKLEKKDKTEETLNEYINELKTRTENNDRKVEQLTNSNAELNKKIVENDRKVQDLESRLQESQQHVQKLENTTKELNETVIQQNMQDVTRTGCQPHQQQQKINELVQAFIYNKNWDTLKAGLDAVLDHSSEVYNQLQARSSSYPLWYIGYYNNRELALLLLCAGLPVSTADSSVYTMLNGATGGGQTQMKELLLQKCALA